MCPDVLAVHRQANVLAIALLGRPVLVGSDRFILRHMVPRARALSLRVSYRPSADRPWMKELGFPPFSGPGNRNSFFLGAKRRGNLLPDLLGRDCRVASLPAMTGHTSRRGIARAAPRVPRPADYGGLLADAGDRHTWVSSAAGRMLMVANLLEQPMDAFDQVGRGIRIRPRWRKTRRVCRELRHIQGPAACRRRRCVCVVLGLDHRQGNIGLVVEDIVGALGLAARDQLAAHDDPAPGEGDFLADLR